MKGSSLVAGTHSDAGKSVVVAGICRWLAREGVAVAPFKAQNMALNSFVTREGAEIGRAQAMQAQAARVEPKAAMNPVLLKPSAERVTQVILHGKPYATASARSYGAMKKELLPAVLESLEDLRRRFDVVVCEGAGSPAEINLRENDIALTVPCAFPSTTTCDDRSLPGLSSTGLNATLGASPHACACIACARPISPPSTVTTELLLMFCALNGATATPRRASHRQIPATSALLPASEVVPATSTAPRSISPARRSTGLP